ncbi:MAG: Guanosine polyphosphate pyrophosphohydrolase [Nitrosopumilus sp.]|nr:Guanosine polyphosphate pyrophosphohydrolase [Candidatus Nitrosopumilus limneticus]MDC4212630.1 HD domain-containing protein [Candidatus Nitrosopumilus limneticus]MDC4215500.1 HD domain-containing protein [Candidatus Nitrosopumilus limneticus]MDC4217371.1 HD domain-containing protein [Candidatus Nitrosopumilus limneticus]MDC4221831.1 HD domain-containing protein [Candidatus Nitrosopumilus limneticus]
MKNKLTLSKQYAIKQHKSQYRKNNKTPYWYHLRDVVDNLEIMGIKDESILCAGWLHDSIEDTSFDFDDVSKLFGEKIAQIVSDLTKETRLPKNQQEKNYLLQLSNSSWKAKVVKFADILANISDLQNSELTKKQKIIQVKYKIKYLGAIKSGIIQNKSKIPNLSHAQNLLNLILEQYGQRKIILF